jgi:hypothetical protein
MGFLDNTSITVDAILTKKGRELLARGDDSFKITKFALADDEVDYKLWDTSHPNGSNYYGAVIENMPVLEAFTDQTQVMRYRLVTLDKNTTRMPVLTVTPQNTDLTAGAAGVKVVASTNTNADTSFTFELNDTSIAYLFPVDASGNAIDSQNFITIQDTESSATVVSEKEVEVRAKSLRTAKSARLTIIGNNTGITKSITLTTLKDQST